MPEDFYIKFLSASSYEDEGHTHYLLAEPRERVEALLPLLYQLIQSDTKPSESYPCPVCNQTLEVSF